MATKAEQETIILINQADKADGYFRFGTTYKTHWLKLLKRAGRDNIKIIAENDASPAHFDARALVPMAHLSAATFGIRVSSEKRDSKAEKVLLGLR